VRAVALGIDAGFGISHQWKLEQRVRNEGRSVTYRLSIAMGFCLAFGLVTIASTIIAGFPFGSFGAFRISLGRSFGAGAVQAVLILLILVLFAPILFRAVFKASYRHRLSFFGPILLIAFCVPAALLLLPPSDGFSYYARGCLAIENGIRSHCGWTLRLERIVWICVMALIASEIAFRLFRQRSKS
jgi:hypothetical protein